MQLYAGIDLHSSNNYLAIIDENGKRAFKKKLANSPEVILEALRPYMLLMFAFRPRPQYL